MSAAAPTDAARHPCSRLGSFLLRHFLAVGLITMLVAGAAYPPPGRSLDDTPLSTILIAVIFFVSGLFLETSAVWGALTSWRATLFGVVSVLVVTPLAGFVANWIGFSPPEVSVGLAIFAAMPTTMSSCVILTGIAKGNVALSLLLTSITSMVSVFTAPVVLDLVLSSGDVSLDAVGLLTELSLIILVPLIGGKLVREVRQVRAVADRYRRPLKLMSTCALIAIPWMKMSASAHKLSALTALDVFVIVVAGFVLHLTYLAFNGFFSLYVFRFKPSVCKAVIITTSQKTLGVAVTVLDLLPDSLGAKGLMLIPIIVAHFEQIFVDAMLASRWVNWNDPDDDDPSALELSDKQQQQRESLSTDSAASDDSTSDAQLV